MSTFLHVLFMVGNAALCVSNLISGDFGWALAQGAIFGVLAYQLAVY